MNKHEKRMLKAQLLKEQAILKELEDEYEAALEQIKDKIAMLQSDVLTQSRIYQLQYQKALKAQVEAILDKLHADEYSTIQQYLSDSYSDGFIGAVYGFHQQGVPVIVPIDKKAAVKAILTDSKIRGSLYEALGIGVNEMKKSIRQEITRGIASGLSYADIARNLHNATKAPMKNVRTIVRTEGHRIQQASQEDARQEAKAAGADVVKQWDATMDSSTRPTHQRLDGQIRETNEPFELGSLKAMYPGDFGDPAEDCNCRCVALTRARWALDEDELERLKERAAYFKLDKKDSFENFKQKYLKASETLEKSGKSGIIKARNFTPRNMSNGGRTSRYHKLTEAEIDSVLKDAETLGIPKNLLRFNQGDQTSFNEKDGVISIRGDVLPDLQSHLLRDNLSQRAVLAHEYYGHYMSHPSKFRIGDWRDEFMASYKAAINAPNLTDKERRMLMLDAFDRAKEAGVTVKYNKKARELIYGDE